MIGAVGAVKFTAISILTSGTFPVVAAVADKKIRVLAVEGGSLGPSSLTWVAATTALTGAVPVGATQAYVRPFNPEGWFETPAKSQALNLNLASSGLFAGSLVYQLVN